MRYAACLWGRSSLRLKCRPILHISVELLVSFTGIHMERWVPPSFALNNRNDNSKILMNPKPPPLLRGGSTKIEGDRSFARIAVHYHIALLWVTRRCERRGHGTHSALARVRIKIEAEKIFEKEQKKYRIPVAAPTCCCHSRCGALVQLGRLKPSNSRTRTAVSRQDL